MLIKENHKSHGKTKKKTTAPVISEEMAVEVEKPAPVVAASMVKVTNKTKYYHIQRSTGIRIDAGETKELKKDGWLEAEIKAGLFKLA